MAINRDLLLLRYKNKRLLLKLVVIKKCFFDSFDVLQHTKNGYILIKLLNDSLWMCFSFERQSLIQSMRYCCSSCCIFNGNAINCCTRDVQISCLLIYKGSWELFEYLEQSRAFLGKKGLTTGYSESNEKQSEQQKLTTNNVHWASANLSDK